MLVFKLLWEYTMPINSVRFLFGQPWSALELKSGLWLDFDDVFLHSCSPPGGFPGMLLRGIPRVWRCLKPCFTIEVVCLGNVECLPYSDGQKAQFCIIRQKETSPNWPWSERGNSCYIVISLTRIIQLLSLWGWPAPGEFKEVLFFFQYLMNEL